MKHCNACDINVNSPIAHCPLCYSSLISIDDKPEIRSYPNFTKDVETWNLVIKLLAFISISIVGICITINLLTSIKYPWSAIVSVCIIYIWVAVGSAVRRNRRIGLVVMVQLISLGILLMFLGTLADFRPMFYNYVLPALIATAILSFNILTIVKRKEITSFLIYYLIVTFIGFLPLILIPLNKITIYWPAASCAVYSILSIVSIFIFSFTAAKSELRKRFHI